MSVGENPGREENAYENIRQVLEKARATAYRAVNSVMTEAYWNIGRIIIEEEQKGRERAGYGRNLIKQLSERLTRDCGRGFTETNLKYMRQFYQTYPKSHALSDELTWTHYRILLKIGRREARDFYQIESAKNNWSIRELERQISSLLYERIALSKDKKEVKTLSLRGQEIQKPQDMINGVNPCWCTIS